MRGVFMKKVMQVFGGIVLVGAILGGVFARDLRGDFSFVLTMLYIAIGAAGSLIYFAVASALSRIEAVENRLGELRTGAANIQPLSSLKNCPACGKEYSSTQSSCPHCGKYNAGISSKTCFSCGKTFPANLSSCPHCSVR